MEKTDVLKELIDIREQTLKLCHDTILKSVEFNLSKTPSFLTQSIDKLKTNNYHVLIAGEAKRGKSSFINAMIGQNILPVNDKITTAQAFKINHSEDESFFLRFIDGTAKEIKKEELIKYGSQESINKQTGIAEVEGKEIDFIEVNTNASFLPHNITLVDTPGMGSLYASHAYVTNRFVPDADAVIFLMDTNRPVLESEISFLKKIVKITSNIFFVLSKIDTVDEWEILLKRNEEILNTEFKGVLDDIKILPINNVKLLEASNLEENKAERYLRISRFEELDRALKVFLFEVSGYSRIKMCLMELAKFVKANTINIKRRLQGFIQSNNKIEAFAFKEIETELNQLNKNWSKPNGIKRAGYLRDINNTVELALTQIRQNFSAASPIIQNIQNDFVSIKRMSELNKWVKNNSYILNDSISDEMIKVSKYLKSKVKEIFVRFQLEFSAEVIDDVEYFKKINEKDFIDTILGLPNPKKPDENIWQKIKGTILKSTKTTISILFTPILQLRQGLDRLINQAETLERAKDGVLAKFRQELNIARDKLNQIDIYNGQNESNLIVYFKSYYYLVDQYIDDNYNEKKDMLENEINILSNSTKKEKVVLSQQKEDWEAFEVNINEINNKLEKLLIMD